ncbi:Ubiquinone biosynthesis O-methyltransferase, mitochondrial [subsurface metagenome]
MPKKSWLVEKTGDLKDFPGEFEDIVCNFCGSTEREILARIKDYETFYPGFFTVVRCLKCGFIYLAPRPTQETLIKYYYPEEYTCYGKQSCNFFDNLRILVICRPKVQLIRQLVNNRTISVLDVGCGDGKLLGYMKHHTNWDLQGVDPNPIATELAREKGLEVTPTTLEGANLRDGAFDVITMCQVIEHVPFPYETMKIVHRILKKGGYFISENPSYGGLECRFFGEHWWGYHAPRHLYQYSYETFSKMAEAAGFKVIKIKSKRRPGGIAWSFQCRLLDHGHSKKVAAFFGLNNPLMAFALAGPEILISLLDRTSMMEVVCQKV